MIAATWSEIFIAQIMIRICAKKSTACKSWASHRTIRLVLSDGSSDGMSSVSDEINYSNYTIT
jgi:hypothetical protein